MGLRERKKQQTRELLAETARRLFAERGFEGVSVAEVAREADVAPATVFNYFPTKEDLFYSGFEAFGERLLSSVAEREPGESALHAVQRYLLEVDGLLARIEAGDDAALQQLRTVSRVIADSPALQARERRAIDRHADRLALLLATETGAPLDDRAAQLNARVAANALMCVHRALIEYARHRVLSDTAPRRIATEVRELGERAFALLAVGLGEYAVRRDRR